MNLRANLTENILFNRTNKQNVSYVVLHMKNLMVILTNKYFKEVRSNDRVENFFHKCKLRHSGFIPKIFFIFLFYNTENEFLTNVDRH